MDRESVSAGDDYKKMKRLQRKMERIRRQTQQRAGNVQQLRITQSARAGHIRGGHGFH